VSHGPHEWRLPFTLDSSSFIGEPAGLAVEHESVTIRVTAVARSRDHVAVAIEARAGGADARVTTIGTGGGPTTFQKHVKSERKPAYPLVLEDEQGRRSESIRWPCMAGARGTRSSYRNPYTDYKWTCAEVLFVAPLVRIR
jgi:hypothetical protein